MSLSSSGIVLYVANLERMSRFYAQTLGLTPEEGDDRYQVLRGETFELVLLVTRGAVGALESAGGARRSDTAIKPVFFVADFALLRQCLAALGGSLEPVSREWLFQGHRVCDGIDPEGNVVQFRMPAPD